MKEHPRCRKELEEIMLIYGVTLEELANTGFFLDEANIWCGLSTNMRRQAKKMLKEKSFEQHQ